MHGFAAARGHARRRSPIPVLAVVGALWLTLLPIAPDVASATELPPGGTFVDDDGSSHEGMIEAIVAEGITAGCSGTARYCPASVVTRGQMATFLARALDLPPTDRDSFPDARGTTHQDSINRIFAAGITSGRTDGTFGPGEPVSRQQMATFLATALELPAASDAPFSDVSGVHRDNVNRVARAGISVGCNPSGTLFCPREPVTRAQMATFLGRALGLTANVPPPRAGLYEPLPGVRFGLPDGASGWETDFPSDDERQVSAAYRDAFATSLHTSVSRGTSIGAALREQEELYIDFDYDYPADWFEELTIRGTDRAVRFVWISPSGDVVHDTVLLAVGSLTVELDYAVYIEDYGSVPDNDAFERDVLSTLRVDRDRLLATFG